MDIYTNYPNYINKLKESEKNIINEITNYQKLSKEGKNTVDFERKISFMLTDFKKSCDKLHSAYSNKNCPSSMSDIVIDSRQKEISEFEISHNKMEKSFNNIQTNKYAYKDRITEDYTKKEEYKDMSTGEIMQLQKDKIREQDARLDEITLDVKKGTQLAKNVQNVIKEQNKQLDQMNEDIDRTKEKMNSLTARFENYVAKYSVCKMIIILLIELAIAIVTGVLLLG